MMSEIVQCVQQPINLKLFIAFLLGANLGVFLMTFKSLHRLMVMYLEKEVIS